MEDDLGALDQFGHAVGIGHVAGADLDAALELRIEIFEEAPVPARVVVHERADFRPAACELLGQMASDEAAGSGHDDADVLPVHVDDSTNSGEVPISSVIGPMSFSHQRVRNTGYIRSFRSVDGGNSSGG
jgi:hypothetical protein